MEHSPAITFFLNPGSCEPGRIINQEFTPALIPIKDDEHILSSVYFLINSDSPVISGGFSIPIISISVGTMSARQPPSLNV